MPPSPPQPYSPLFQIIPKLSTILLQTLTLNKLVFPTLPILFPCFLLILVENYFYFGGKIKIITSSDNGTTWDNRTSGTLNNLKGVGFQE